MDKVLADAVVVAGAEAEARVVRKRQAPPEGTRIPTGTAMEAGVVKARRRLLSNSSPTTRQSSSTRRR